MFTQAIHGPVLLDFNTQFELFDPHGGRPVIDVAPVVSQLRCLFQWATRRAVPIVSTRLRDVALPITGHQPLVLGQFASAGYHKIPTTLRPNPLLLPADNRTDVPADWTKHHPQIIVDLLGFDPFEAPRMDRILTEMPVELWLLCGGPIEHTVRIAALGMLQRRAKIVIVRDAIAMWDRDQGDMAIRQLQSKNITWMTTAEVLQRWPVMTKRPSAVTAPIKPPALRRLRKASVRKTFRT
jgi:nicotinamidase-related amidase